MSLLSVSFLPSAFSRRIRLITCLSGVASACAALSLTPAAAQVTTDTSALDSISPVKKTAPPDKSAKTGAGRPHSHEKTSSRTSHEAAKPADTGTATAPAVQGTAGPSGGTAASGTTTTHSGKPPPSPTIPAAPPPIPVLTPPPIPVELHPFPMPPDPPAEKDATGAAIPIPGGIRITFAPDSAQLTTETRAAILAVAQSLKERPETRAMVDATSGDATNDPSRPRRMSLSRGLAVRAVLMNAGIPSTRIYVRVIGSSTKTDLVTPADRVDIRRSDAVP